MPPTPIKRGRGRPPKCFKYGEATVVRRLPASLAKTVDSLLGVAAHQGTDIEVVASALAMQRLPKLPLIGWRIAAGFPSPAEDFVEGKLDLQTLVVKNPAATFYVRVSGPSMIGLGIFPGDILTVDRAIPPKHKDVVIAVVDGELTVKQLYRKGNVIRLDAANPDFAPIEIDPEAELTVWGVVTYNIHRFR